MATAGTGEAQITLERNGVAYEEIENFKILCFSNVDERVIKATAATINPLGVSQVASDIHKTETYAAGYVINMAMGGICDIIMSGSGLRGNAIVATTDGYGTKFTLGSADQWSIGQAMRDWNDGDVIPVHIDKTYIGDTADAS